MSTVVQTTYKPQILPAVVGMIASEVNCEVGTRINEVAAGVGFGLAVGQGALSDKGIVIATSLANFIGVTVRDVTLNQVPVDPLAADGTTITADVFAQYQNVPVLSRGDIWVLCYGGGDTGVGASNALYFDTNGHFTNSASGSYSFGSTTFTQQPAVNDTLVVNGDTWTWVASGATGLQLNIGPTLGDSIRMAATTLEASSSTNTEAMTYKSYPPSPAGAVQGSGANTLQYASETVGTGVYTVTSSTTGATVTAMTAGVATSYGPIVGGYWKTSAIAGQVCKISLGIQR